MTKETIKTFYLKYLTILAIPVALFLSVMRLDAYTQKQNFYILNERESVIIQLPNTEYLELASRNDNITNYVDFSEKPFPSTTKIQKLSGLENTLAIIDSHTEYIENGPMNTRLLKLTQKGKNDIEIEITAKTAFRYLDGLVYTTQIDYTNRTTFHIEGSKVSFLDKGCTITITGEGITYSVYENNQSLILAKPYTPEVTYTLDVNITCSN